MLPQTRGGRVGGGGENPEPRRMEPREDGTALETRGRGRTVSQEDGASVLGRGAEVGREDPVSSQRRGKDGGEAGAQRQAWPGALTALPLPCAHPGPPWLCPRPAIPSLALSSPQAEPAPAGAQRAGCHSCSKGSVWSLGGG